MSEPFPGTPPSVRTPEDRLDSWKEIAAYLNRDVTTVHLVREVHLAERGGTAGGLGEGTLFPFSCAAGRFRLCAHVSNSARNA